MTVPWSFAGMWRQFEEREAKADAARTSGGRSSSRIPARKTRRPMPPERQVLLRRSARAERMLRAASTHGHSTEHFALLAQCSVGEAVVELLRLEREGLIVRGRNGYGMTWKAVA